MQIFTSKAPPLTPAQSAACRIQWKTINNPNLSPYMAAIDTMVENFERRRKYYFNALPTNWKNLRTPADWRIGFNGCAEYEVLAFVSPYPPQIVGSVFETPDCDLDAAARQLISTINPDLELAADNYWYVLLPKMDALAVPPLVLEQLFSGAYWKIKEWRRLEKEDLAAGYSRPFSENWEEIVLRQAPEGSSLPNLAEEVVVDFFSRGGTSRRSSAKVIRTSEDMHDLGIEGDLYDINTHVRVQQP